MKSMLLAGLLAVAGSLAFGADAAYWKEQLLGTAYIWNGGAAGTWDATTENWIGLDGNPTVWEDGQTAAFPEAATITVSGTKTVSGIMTAAYVNFSGDLVHLMDEATVSYQENSILTFDNDVTMGTNVQFQVRGAIETTSSQSTSFMSETEEILILPGVTLTEMMNADVVLFSLDSHWGAPHSSTLTLVDTPREDGLYMTIDEGGTTATGYLRYFLSSWFGGILECIKIRFTERSEGIYAIVEWVRYAVGLYDLPYLPEEYESVWDIDFDTYPCRNAHVCGQDEELTENYYLRIYNFQMLTIDVAPETTVMQVNGNYENAGRVYLDTANLVINGRYDCTTGPLPNFRMSNGGSVTIGPDAKATLTTLGTQDGENRFWDGPVNIYSPVLLNNSRSGGFGPYSIFANCPAVNVWDGGSLTVSNNVWNQYGLNGMQLNIYTGGVFRATAHGQLGRSTHSISIIGGTLINDYDLVGKNENDQCSLYDLRMEGGRVEGASLSTLFDCREWSRASNWTIAGTEPSVVATDTIRLGAPNATLSAESKISQFLNLDVNDVTGDEATDLLISSRFYVVQSLTITEDGYPLNGFRKQGAGTLELSGTGSESLGMFHVQEGLVRFTDEISFLGWSISTNTVLTVQDGSVDLGPLENWTDGATLYVKGADMTNRSLRVGEDANALTEAQLASCWYVREDGALRKMTLSADGYLAPPPSAVMILIR